MSGNLVKWLRCVIISAVLPFPMLGGAAGHFASDDEVRWYHELYPASVLRSMQFAVQPDPDSAIREEIYLESRLAEIAEKSELTSDVALMADIAHYQDSEILNAYLRTHLKRDVITTADINEYYLTHQHEFVETTAVRFRHLFLIVPPGDAKAEAEKRALAERLYKQVQRGIDFEKLVVEYSELKDAKRNKGVVGPEDPARLGPQVRAALETLREGETTGPIRTRYGWEILQLLQRRSSRVRPLDEVARTIRSVLERAKANSFQEMAAQELPKKYPAVVNDSLLNSTQPLVLSEWVFSLDGTTFTVAQLLPRIRAMWSYEHIPDERERLRAALPRIILTEQVKLAAKQQGLLASDDLRAKMRFIRNRLMAERYIQQLPSKIVPTEDDLRKTYEADRNVFVKPPQGKGTVFRWFLQADPKTSPSAAVAYSKQLLRDRVEKILAEARSGRLSREDLRKHADEVQDLDWFPEGPNGYLFDKAFFAAPPKSYTEIFSLRNGFAFCWVEDKRPSSPRPFEECRDLVRRRYCNLKAEKMGKELIADILKEYASSQ